jgi:penicillin-binding protein 1C
LDRERGSLYSKGISNAAAVVIDNESGDLLSLVGSLDFFDNDAGGQVNGALASRSPGSALKPFVYALGFEQGLITPQSLLADVPQDYSGYRPSNYDDTYHGAVTVEQALIHSYNVPAVNLYAKLGSRGLYSFLKRAGTSTLPQEKEYYGLSLVLGGCGVNLLELTNLYSVLARGGRFAPCRISTTQSRRPAVKLLSTGTCYMLTDILCQLQRPELPAVWEWSVNQPKVAWKTGTSYGHRDAWSIGYTPKYTAGVWVGNFDGKGARELVGAEIAAPILFDIFAALEEPGEVPWFSPPGDVDTRQVCAVSGMPLSEHCTTAKTDLYLPGISAQQVCSIHRKLLVDDETGYCLCFHCRQGHEYHEEMFEEWPAGIATWMERNGYPIKKAPQHNPDCGKVATGEGPIIYSPLAATEYKLRAGVDPEYQQILLDAKVSNETAKIFWFFDRELVYSGPPTSQLFVSPEIGSHSLVCMDDQGRSAEVEIMVRPPGWVGE